MVLVKFSVKICSRNGGAIPVLSSAFPLSAATTALTAASRPTVALRCSSLTTSLGLRHTANKVTRMLCYMVGCMKTVCSVKYHGWMGPMDGLVPRTCQMEGTQSSTWKWVNDHKGAKLTVFHGCQTYSCVTKYTKHDCPCHNIHFSVGPSLPSLCHH